MKDIEAMIQPDFTEIKDIPKSEMFDIEVIAPECTIDDFARLICALQRSSLQNG